MKKAFDIDGVITQGHYPSPNDIIITGRSYEEEYETTKFLHSIGLFNKVYFNQSVTINEKNFVTSGMHKAKTILELGIEEFYEDEERQAEIIRKNCKTCNVILIKDISMKLLEDAIEIQKQYYSGKIGESTISKEISNFAYFVYNHPEAPIYLPKDDYEIVILMSGGIDSFVAYHYAKTKFNNVKALYIDYGYPYSQVEKEAIQCLEIELLPYEDHSYLLEIQKEGESLWGEIFPGRNWLLSIIASKYIKTRGEIWMAAIGGEVKELWGDKSEYFFTNASKILSENTQKQIRVTTPFKSLTKGQIVKWYKDRGLDLKVLGRTVSCHYIAKYGDIPCGHCMGCAHRYVGMEYNGIREDYQSNIKEFAKKLYSKELLNPLSEFSTQRKIEVELAIT